jgi:hypothetical protein
MTPTYVANVRDKESKLVLAKLIDFRQSICRVMITFKRLPYDGLKPIISPLKVSLYSCEQAINQIFVEAGEPSTVISYPEAKSLFISDVPEGVELHALIDMRIAVEQIAQDLKRFMVLFPPRSIDMTTHEIRCASQLLTASLWIQTKILQLKSKGV